MSTITINWTCTASPGWEWLSDGPGNAKIPLDQFGQISGSIRLSPNEQYWYPCIRVVLPDGSTTGNALLRYFIQKDGAPVVQAMTVAQGQWVAEGAIGPLSVTDSKGGVNLVAQLAQ